MERKLIFLRIIVLHLWRKCKKKTQRRITIDKTEKNSYLYELLFSIFWNKCKTYNNKTYRSNYFGQLEHNHLCKLLLCTS